MEGSITQRSPNSRFKDSGKFQTQYSRFGDDEDFPVSYFARLFFNLKITIDAVIYKRKATLKTQE